MSETSNVSMISYEGGNVMFSPDVVATIAGIATLKVNGVAGMSGGITDGIVQILGIKNFKKGVKAEINGNDVTVSMSIVMRYDANMQNVCMKIQSDVKEAIETMTGLGVAGVNVIVQGVNFDEEQNTKK